MALTYALVDGRQGGRADLTSPAGDLAVDDADSGVFTANPAGRDAPATQWPPPPWTPPADTDPQLSAANGLPPPVCPALLRHLTVGWMMAGDAGNFIDPIFSGGTFLAVATGRESARTLDRLLPDPVGRLLERHEPVHCVLGGERQWDVRAIPAARRVPHLPGIGRH